MKELIVIGGPTASGKTALSVALAKQWNTVVLSADSRQFYKEMSIGTAKPSHAEMQGIPHYFIDSHSVEDEVNAARFANEAEILLTDLFQRYDTIILTGGSGMFIDALCYGLDNIPHDQHIQQQLNQVFEQEGLKPLLQELREKDPEFYSIVDRNNPVRVIRALEAIRITGLPYSSLRKGTKRQHNYTIRYFVIDVPRDVLYDRINLRVDQMVENGLEAEAKALLPHRQLKPLATVGYSEWFRYFDGEIDRETCIELIKQNSRRYAKRQITWFKRNEEAVWVPSGAIEEMMEMIK
ncbi:tRNA (adenosine(37)-N6)-dimethylallyltransferase MiaA [Taishania pollutisoli]|uniref:tRNA (adenosine(37)-N6)-dimethylallyltransferase MiaA n=1 Tax=Taishania pollutisoli TaxID=2766479 RepID=UPI001C1E37C4|nr:tRNA (adenosine(37)-N6)-dimethylallyltransferase MiaA [Taishania pollutisoli]